MDVVIKNRDFSDRLPLPASLEVRPVDYVWNQIGGPKTATLKCNFSVDVPSLFNLLRCPVEIYGDDGLPKWWGYVNRVTLPNGTEQRVGMGLDEVHNTVRIEYDDGVTADATNTESISEYGVKEYRARVSNCDSTQGGQFRDLHLVAHAKARPEFPKSGGEQDVIIECNGWWDTLGWVYYENANTANVEHTTQIVNMVGTAGQFLQGVLIENLANQTSTAERDGTGTALGHIVQLLNAGTDNVRPLLATVDVNRYLHVFEREAEPSTGLPKYFLDRQNQLITHLGNPVNNQDCKVNVWAQLQDPPDILKGFSAMQPFYIAEAKYDVERDKVTYTPANSYEQVRLKQFVANAVDSNSGGGLGSVSGISGVPGIWWTPAPAPTTRDIMTRKGVYWSDLSSGSGVYIHPGTNNTSLFVNQGSIGLTEATFKPSSADETGWKADDDAYYLISAWIHCYAGTTPPTYGHVILQAYRAYPITGKQSIAGVSEAWSVGPGGTPDYGTTIANGFQMSLHTGVKIQATYGLVFFVSNFTDGQIQVEEMRVMFEKVG